MLSINKAGVADIPLIRQIAMDVWPQTYIPIVGAEQVAYMLELFYSPEALEQQMLQGHEFIICLNDGRPVAFAAWSEVAPGIAKLHKLYVLPNQQGNGVGKAIIGHIVNELRNQSVLELRLNVNRYNTAAMAFYEKSGFAKLMDEDIDIGSGYFMNDHVLRLAVG